MHTDVIHSGRPTLCRRCNQGRSQHSPASNWLISEKHHYMTQYNMLEVIFHHCFIINTDYLVRGGGYHISLAYIHNLLQSCQLSLCVQYVFLSAICTQFLRLVVQHMALWGLEMHSVLFSTCRLGRQSNDLTLCVNTEHRPHSFF